MRASKIAQINVRSFSQATARDDDEQTGMIIKIAGRHILISGQVKNT